MTTQPLDRTSSSVSLEKPHLTTYMRMTWQMVMVWLEAAEDEHWQSTPVAGSLHGPASKSQCVMRSLAAIRRMTHAAKEISGALGVEEQCHSDVLGGEERKGNSMRQQQTFRWREPRTRSWWWCWSRCLGPYAMDGGLSEQEEAEEEGREQQPPRVTWRWRHPHWCAGGLLRRHACPDLGRMQLPCSSAVAGSAWAWLKYMPSHRKPELLWSAAPAWFATPKVCF